MPKSDKTILNKLLPQIRKQLHHNIKIDHTYVPPSVLRYNTEKPYAIVFDTLDNNHYFYDIATKKLSNVRDMQRTY